MEIEVINFVIFGIILEIAIMRNKMDAHAGMYMQKPHNVILEKTVIGKSVCLHTKIEDSLF